MKARAYWFVSLVLATAAIWVHIAALGEVSKGMKLRARAVVATDLQKESLKAEAKHYTSRSVLIALTGLVVAIGSAACLIVSFRRREPAWHSIPFALLVFYVLLQFAII